MRKFGLLVMAGAVFSMIISLGYTMEVHAITITSTESRYEGNDVRYFFTVSNWSRFDEKASPCGGRSWQSFSCEVNISVRPVGGITSLNYIAYKYDIDGSPNIMTLGNMLMRLGERGFYVPFNGSVLIPSGSDKAMCVYIDASNQRVAGGIGREDITYCYPLKQPPQPPVQCSLTGNTIIDHKTLTDNAVDGARALTVLNLHCDGEASVTIKSTRTNSYGVRLRSDDSLYSEVKVNNEDAFSGVVVNVVKNLGIPVNISSTLKSRGAVDPGAFFGSTVMTVSPN